MVDVESSEIAGQYSAQKSRHMSDRGTRYVSHTVRVKALGAVYQEARLGNYTLQSDEHSGQWGGQGRAPSPFQYILVALGFSINDQVAIQAAVMGVRLESLETIASGSFDVKGYYIIRGHDPRIRKVGLDFWVESEAPRSSILSVIQKAANGCPVYRTLRRSGRIERRLHLNEGAPPEAESHHSHGEFHLSHEHGGHQ